MKEPQEKDKKEILKRIKQEKEQEKLKTKEKVIEQKGIEWKKSQRNSRKKKIKEKLEKSQARTKERFQEQEQLVEREKFKEKLTEQNESIEGFKNVVGDFEVERIKMHGDCIEGVDELDEIEIMRESIETRCEKFYISEFGKVKVIGKIIKDVLKLENKLRGYMDKN